MDPSQCSAIVLHHPKPRPFLIDASEPLGDDIPSYVPLLQSVFGQVCICSNPSEAVDQAAAGNSLLLVDLDDSADDDGDEAALTSPASSIEWIVRNAGHVPIVACSTNDKPSFMLECIRAGAADYVLKPLRLDVIKTLFLKLCRCQSDDTAPREQTLLPPMDASASRDGLHHRVKSIMAKDRQFSQAFMDIYAPTCNSVRKPAPLTSDHAAMLKNKLSSWDFFPFDFDHDDLIHCVYLIFQQVLTLPKLDLAITPSQLYDFITELANIYHDTNPYHNFAHAVDVLQCTYYFLCQLGLLSLANGATLPFAQERTGHRPQDLLRPKDIFALFIAAIGHDAAHPGVNNMFLINSATPLALMYNDKSVLESFHSMTLFQIIKKYGFAGEIETSDYQEFRRMVVTSILATDMSLHNDYVAKFKEQAIRLRGLNLSTVDAATQEHERLLICSVIIKCADISNVTRPYERSAEWAELLVEEFACQGDLERALNMPVLPLNDREKLVLEDSQIGFIRFVAMGLFECARDVMGEINFALEQMQRNLERWEHRKNSTHDSGVSTLDLDSPRRAEKKSELPDPAPAVRKDSSEYHTQAVEALHRRLSIDSTRSSRSGMFSNLPTMPAVAMSSYGDGVPAHDHDSQFMRRDPAPWPTHDANLAYCQCVLQW